MCVLQSPEESVWTERSDLKITWPENGDAYTNAYIALDVLGEYVEEHSNMFESVDHVALFSGSVKSSLLQQFIIKVVSSTRNYRTSLTNSADRLTSKDVAVFAPRRHHR